MMRRLFARLRRRKRAVIVFRDGSRFTVGDGNYQIRIIGGGGGGGSGRRTLTDCGGGGSDR